MFKQTIVKIHGHFMLVSCQMYAKIVKKTQVYTRFRKVMIPFCENMVLINTKNGYKFKMLFQSSNQSAQIVWKHFQRLTSECRHQCYLFNGSSTGRCALFILNSALAFDYLTSVIAAISHAIHGKFLHLLSKINIDKVH